MHLLDVAVWIVGTTMMERMLLVVVELIRRDEVSGPLYTFPN